MENINAVLINDGMPQGERLVKLNQIAIQQMQVLEDNSERKLLKWEYVHVRRKGQKENMELLVSSKYKQGNKQGFRK